MMRRLRLPLILIVALFIRLVALDSRPLWYDEAFAILFAGAGFDAMLAGTLTPVAGGAADIHPLLYYVMLDGWMRVWGTSPAAVRLLSVVLGVATVALVYVLARVLFDHEDTGLTAAVLVAFMPFHIQYAQEARMYSLLTCLLIAATVAYVRGMRPPAPLLLGGALRRFVHRWGWWLVFGVCAALAMYTQQLAAFYLAALAVYAVASRQPRLISGVVLGAAVALVLYLPWLVQLPAQLAKVGAYYWIPVPPLPRLLLTLRTYYTAALDLPLPFGVYALGGALFVTLLLALGIVRALRQPRRADRPALTLALTLAFAPMGLMWLVSQVRPVYLERALLPSALMAAVVVAWAFTRGGVPRPIQAALVVVLGALALNTLVTHYTWTRFPNAPFNAAAVAIAADWRAGDVVVHQNKLSALPMRVYAPAFDQRYLADAPGSPEDTLALPTQQALGWLADMCVQAAAGGAARVWFVVFADALRQYEAAGRSDLVAASAWLDGQYAVREPFQFGDLDVIRYSQPRRINPETCP